MTRMPDFVDDILHDSGEAADALRRLIHHHPTSTAPAAATPTITTNSTEATPMSFIDEAEAHAKALLDTFGQADREALRLMEALKANPGAVALVQAAEGYLHLPPAAFDIAISGLATVAKLYPDAPQPAPAGPQVGGQA